MPKKSATNEPSRKAPSIFRGSWLRPWHFLLAAFGGALYFLGFAGFSIWPLAFICHVPMYFLIDQEVQHGDRQTIPAGRRLGFKVPGLLLVLLGIGLALKLGGPALVVALPGIALLLLSRLRIDPGARRISVLGAVQGFVTCAGGYHWLVDMLEIFSGFPAAICWCFASIFFFYSGLRDVVLCNLLLAARRKGAPHLAAGVASLALVEFAFPMLFPSFLATGFHNIPEMIQVADLGGAILLSAVVMAVNAAIYLLLVFVKRRGALPKRSLAIAALGLTLTLGYGTWRVSEVDARAAEAEHLRVGMVQVDMGIFEKREQPYLGHQRHLEQSEALEDEYDDLGLIVWPESAYTFLVPEDRNLQNRVLGPVRTPTLFGGLSARPGEERREMFNTAFLVDGNGELLGTYDKTYLLMFGEYLPFGETFPEMYEISRASGRFTPGNHVRPLELGDTRISTLICYEDVLPGFTRQAVNEANPHLFANITNDAWFGDTQEPWIHLALAKFRSVEHHRAMVRSTNSGVSAFIDPVGRVVSELGVGVRGQLAESLPLMESNTVYATLGDWPGYLSIPALLFLILRPRSSREKDEERVGAEEE